MTSFSSSSVLAPECPIWAAGTAACGYGPSIGVSLGHEWEQEPRRKRERNRDWEQVLEQDLEQRREPEREWRLERVGRESGRELGRELELKLELEPELERGRELEQPGLGVGARFSTADVAGMIGIEVQKLEVSEKSEIIGESNIAVRDSKVFP